MVLQPLRKAIQYEWEVGHTAWSTSITKITWWKAILGCFVVGIALNVSTNDFSHLGSNHGIKAASTGLGAAVLAFAELLPESPKTNRHFRTLFRALIGLMLVVTALHWLYGEIDGQVSRYFRAISVVGLGMGMAGAFGAFLVVSMYNWEEGVHRRRKRLKETDGESAVPSDSVSPGDSTP